MVGKTSVPGEATLAHSLATVSFWSHHFIIIFFLDGRGVFLQKSTKNQPLILVN